MELSPGSSIRFDYPAANYACARSKLERRRLQVAAVRDTLSEPLEAFTLNANPCLARGRYLVTGHDLDKGEERSFYWESMRAVEPIDERAEPVELVLCEPGSDPEMITTAPSVAAALAGAREWLREPLGLIVGLRRA